MAPYASLSAFALVALLIAALLRIPDARRLRPHRRRPPFVGPDRRQPAFVVAVLAAAVGYGTMNLLMAATPLAMDVCGLGLTTWPSCCSGTCWGCTLRLLHPAA